MLYNHALTFYTDRIRNIIAFLIVLVKVKFTRYL